MIFYLERWPGYSIWGEDNMSIIALLSCELVSDKYIKLTKVTL